MNLKKHEYQELSLDNAKNYFVSMISGGHLSTLFAYLVTTHLINIHFIGQLWYLNIQIKKIINPDVSKLL